MISAEESKFKKTKLDIFGSTFFMASLTALIVNDFVLKQFFHNDLTGKLSDFAGLAVFSLFWCSFFPTLTKQIFLVTALSFVYWKTPLSQPLINFLNGFAPFSISRTVDSSDLIALLILPVCYLASCPRIHFQKHRLPLYLIVLISLFAFTATSFSEKTSYENRFEFSISKKELVEKMARLPEHDVHNWFPVSNEFEVSFDSCISLATITVSELNNKAVVQLHEIDYRCPRGGNKEEMLRFFETEFIAYLNDPPPTQPSKINYIWAKGLDSGISNIPTPAIISKWQPLEFRSVQMSTPDILRSFAASAIRPSVTSQEQ